MSLPPYGIPTTEPALSLVTVLGYTWNLPQVAHTIHLYLVSKTEQRKTWKAQKSELVAGNVGGHLC